jgi:hypothetical protein
MPSAVVVNDKSVIIKQLELICVFSKLTAYLPGSN